MTNAAEIISKQFVNYSTEDLELEAPVWLVEAAGLPSNADVKVIGYKDVTDTEWQTYNNSGALTEIGSARIWASALLADKDDEDRTVIGTADASFITEGTVEINEGFEQSKADEYTIEP